MNPQQALSLIAGILDAVTLIAKDGGRESGLTAGDRVQIQQAVAIVRGELNRAAETQQGKKKRN